MCARGLDDFSPSELTAPSRHKRDVAQSNVMLGAPIKIVIAGETPALSRMRHTGRLLGSHCRLRWRRAFPPRFVTPKRRLAAATRRRVGSQPVLRDARPPFERYHMPRRAKVVCLEQRRRMRLGWHCAWLRCPAQRGQGKRVALAKTADRQTR